jgi:hypothetical protein
LHDDGLASFLKAFDPEMPRQPPVFECCAGAGFIVFARLGYGFWQRVVSRGANPEAVEACRRTVAQTALRDTVPTWARLPVQSRAPVDLYRSSVHTSASLIV